MRWLLPFLKVNFPLCVSHHFLAYHTYLEATSLQKRIYDCHKEKKNIAKKGKEVTYFYVDASAWRTKIAPHSGKIYFYFWQSKIRFYAYAALRQLC